MTATLPRSVRSYHVNSGDGIDGLSMRVHTPRVPGVGEVIAVGPGVHRVRPGDRVTATLFPKWQDGPLQPSYLPQLGGSLDGLLTELAVLPEQRHGTR